MRTASNGNFSRRETVAMHVEPLALIGQDEAVFLLLVEPQHLPLHLWSAFLRSRCLQKREMRARWRASPLRVLSQLDDVLRLGTLRALGGFELDLGTLGQWLEAVTCDGAVVDEQILTGFLGGNKSVSLGVVEPLDSSSCHRKNTSSTNSRTVVEARLPTSYSLYTSHFSS